MLTASLLLTGVLGLLQERTYTKYGPCWREGLFYTVSPHIRTYLLLLLMYRESDHSMLSHFPSSSSSSQTSFTDFIASKPHPSKRHHISQTTTPADTSPF